MADNYVARVRARLEYELRLRDAECPPELVDFYALLALIRGVDTSLEDVHDAWSVWTARQRSEHKSLVPFAQLSQAIQGLDRPYRDAIRAVAGSGDSDV